MAVAARYPIAAIAADAVVAIYGRVSKEEKQQGMGLEVQVEALTDDAKRSILAREPARPLRVYQDLFTGTEADRPALNQLNADVRAGHVAHVLVWAIDRLARNTEVAIALVKEWLARGVQVRVVSGGMPVDATPESQLNFQIRAAFSQHELSGISRRTNNAIELLIKRGVYARRAIYGYRRVPEGCRVAPDPDTAPVVVRIYELIAAGWSVRAVARQLTAEAVPCAWGGHVWRRKAIRMIVQNTTYKGEARFRYLRTVEHARSKKGKRYPVLAPVPAAQQLPPVAVPALVSARLWQAANDKLDLNRVSTHRHGRRGNAPALLRGLAVCANCQERVYALTPKDRAWHYRILRPTEPDPRKAPCPHRTQWNLSDVDARVRAAFITYYVDPARYHAREARRSRADQAKLAARVAQLAERLAKVDAGLARVVSLYGDPDLPRATIDREKANLAQQRGALVEELAVARGHQGAPALALVARKPDAVRLALERADMGQLHERLKRVCLRVDLGATEARVWLYQDGVTGEPAPTAGGAGERQKVGGWPRPPGHLLPGDPPAPRQVVALVVPLAPAQPGPGGRRQGAQAPRSLNRAPRPGVTPRPGPAATPRRPLAPPGAPPRGRR